MVRADPHHLPVEEGNIVEEGNSMNIVEEDKIVTNSLTIKAGDMVELLEGAITHADKGKDAIRALNSVQILGGAGQLIARATDRYRLIEGKIEVEGHLDHSLIALDDVKRVISLAKDNKYGSITLTRVGDLLTVSINGSAITLQLLGENYPKTFNDLLNEEKRDNLGVISFNPSFMADYAKIVGKGKAIKVEFIGENKPMIVILAGEKVEWKALLMPMRII
jgi:DNA polymerase III sliding clamp (beta) subunit (PCNA family)